MTRRKFIRRAAIPAVALAAGLTMVGWTLAPNALAKTPNRLQLFIENQSVVPLYRTAMTSIKDSPGTIAPSATGEVKVASAQQVYASITYADNADASKATCKANVSVTYSYNSTTNKCDDKSFQLSQSGKCEVEQIGTCSGANSCKCSFAVRPTN